MCFSLFVSFSTSINTWQKSAFRMLSSTISSQRSARIGLATSKTGSVWACTRQTGRKDRYRVREKQAERDKLSKLKYINNLANKFSVTKTHILACFWLLAHDNLMQHNRRDGIIRIELVRSGWGNDADWQALRSLEPKKRGQVSFQVTIDIWFVSNHANSLHVC